MKALLRNLTSSVVLICSLQGAAREADKRGAPFLIINEFECEPVIFHQMNSQKNGVYSATTQYHCQSDNLIPSDAFNELKDGMTFNFSAIQAKTDVGSGYENRRLNRMFTKVGIVYFESSKIKKPADRPTSFEVVYEKPLGFRHIGFPDTVKYVKDECSIERFLQGVDLSKAPIRGIGTPPGYNAVIFTFALAVNCKKNAKTAVEMSMNFAKHLENQVAEEIRALGRQVGQVYKVRQVQSLNDADDKDSSDEDAFHQDPRARRREEEGIKGSIIPVQRINAPAEVQIKINKD